VKQGSNEMAGSTSSNEDTHEDAAYREYELNLEMWRHYDNLRQEKSKTFLTAQTILIAVSGFVLQRKEELSFELQMVVIGFSVVGLVSSCLWFLLLSRNKGYISFHRDQVQKLELQHRVKFTTFSKNWCVFEGELWPKRSSNTIDRGLASLFVLFWLVLGVGVFLF
jgi:hypothetical protein